MDFFNRPGFQLTKMIKKINKGSPVLDDWTIITTIFQYFFLVLLFIYSYNNRPIVQNEKIINKNEWLYPDD